MEPPIREGAARVAETDLKLHAAQPESPVVPALSPFVPSGLKLNKFSR